MSDTSEVQWGPRQFQNHILLIMPSKSVQASANQESKKAYDNPILEFFSKTHIAVPLVLYYGLPVVLIAYGIINDKISALMVPVMFLGGFLAFTLLEYVVHRYVFHMPVTTKIKENIQFALHGLHHREPRDKKRLAMPPISSLILAVIFYSFFQLVMGDYTFGFLPGFMAGYASYLAVHYIVHIWPMPKNWFKILWVNHNIHHYKDHTVAFGVSSPLWDVVLGTMPEVKEKKTSK